MMKDHSQCTETVLVNAVDHCCGVCPHGLEYGGTWATTGDPKADAKQRTMKLLAIDRLSCINSEHDAILARMGR